MPKPSTTRIFTIGGNDDSVQEQGPWHDGRSRYDFGHYLSCPLIDVHGCIRI
jgi:hypothetical protein